MGLLQREQKKKISLKIVVPCIPLSISFFSSIVARTILVLCERERERDLEPLIPGLLLL